jgi:hypothetical protein
MSRDQMRGLKAKKDLAKHLQNIKNHVTHIYKAAIDAAESFGHTSYSFCIDPEYSNVDYDFYIDNMEEILSGLQDLFLDCYVTHTMIGPSEKERECIVIDWS